MTYLNSDVIIACADLAGRAGASSFDIGYLHDNVPADQAGWYATAHYRGARIVTDEHRFPDLAAFALALRLLSDATCRCTQPVTLTDGATGCRWRLVGARWEPGCDAPPLRYAGPAGDHAAMAVALAGANRAQRRAARKRGVRRG